MISARAPNLRASRSAMRIMKRRVMQRAQALGAFFVDLRLHLGKGHEVDAHAVFVFAQYLCQLQHLVQRQFAGVGRALEVDGAGDDAALHQLIAGHGAVDAAGE